MRDVTTQGIPDDLRPAQELPLDVAGALESLYRRLCTLDDEFARIRSELLRVRAAVKERERA